MSSRIPNYLPARARKGQPSQSIFQELQHLAQKQIADRVRQIETYVQEQPVTAISTAFCIGILLGWVIKRR